MRPLIVLTILFAACSHEDLDFALPKGGNGGNGSAPPGGSVDPASSCQNPANAMEAMQSSSQNAGGPAASPAGAGAESSAHDGGRGASSESNQGRGQPERYQDDPRGYPTGPGQVAASCERGQSFEEVCGNDVDEDCDGTVDEYPGIGVPCRSGCGEGIYVCSASTNALLCRGRQGCMTQLPESCGDGFVDSDEACDPNASSEEAGSTCTLTCERPLFIRCVDAGVSHPERCDALHVCNDRIGACMPVLGPQQPRCPQLPIEGADNEFYPMLETENGECWVTCSESAQCPSSLSECYMGFCAVPF